MTLLQQIAAGDQSAVARVLDEYGGLVWNLAARYLGGERSEVEDAVQEVFMSLWMSASRFDPAKGSEPAFVATIAHRRLTDYRRKVGARRGLRLAVEARAQEDVRAGGRPGERGGPMPDELSKLGSEFASLPPDEQAALWLAVTRGMSHREIAAAMSAPIGTVKSRLRRAVMRLQEAWGLTPGSELERTVAAPARAGAEGVA